MLVNNIPIDRNWHRLASGWQGVTKAVVCVCPTSCPSVRLLSRRAAGDSGPVVAWNPTRPFSRPKTTAHPLFVTKQGMTTSLSLSPALPESVVCVVDGDDDDCCVCVDYDDYGKTRVCVTDALGFHDQKNKNYELYEHKITAHMTPYTTHVPFRLLPASTSPTAPFPLIHSPRTALASTWDDAYDADEEFYESDNQRQGTSLSSTFPSLITTTTTTVTATTTITTATATATAISTSNVPNTLHRWPTKANMPTLRGRRSFLSSKVHSLLHPPSIDGHSSSLEDAPPRPPVPSFYTTATASSTEDDYTTGSEDFFATSPESLRLHEHDSYLLDDDPDPFANYLSRARSSSSINSSHLDHTHPHAAQTHPLTATATATAAPTQPKPFLTRIPTFTSRARRRLSMTGPPTPNGSIRRQRLFTRPSLPSLVSLAQKLGTNLPTTNEDSDPDFPIPLLPSLNSSSQPVGHRLYGSSVDPSKDPDGAVAPMSRSSPSLIGRGGRSILVDTNTDVQYLPVVGTNNSNASLNIYPHLLFPDDPNASVIRRPGAAESASFIAGSGSGNGSHQQCQQNHTPGSNQYSHSSYSGGGMGGGGGTGGGSGGGGGGGSGNRSDGDRSRRPRGQYKDYSSTDTHATTTEDERGTHSSRGGSGSGDSDDTPLAWRLPGALTAQKSLRRQVKEDRDMQRQVRARARAKSAPRSQVPTTTRPADGDRSESLSVDELTRKLLKVQVQSSSPSPVHNEQQQTSTSTSTYHKYAFTATPPHPHGPEAYPVNRRGSESSDRHYPHASPVARPNNTAQPNTMGNMTAFPPSPHPQQQPAPHNLQRAMTSATARSRPRSDRPSHEMPEQRQRTDTLVPPSRIRQRANTLSSPSSSRPSTSWTAAPASTAPVPPLPVAAHVPTLPGRGFAHAGEGGLTMLQRVFVGDMQRFSTVEIGHGTKARDVVALIDERGELPRDAKAGGWMLFELSNDFGMGE